MKKSVKEKKGREGKPSWKIYVCKKNVKSLKLN